MRERKLDEIRRKMGLPGKHPANLCQNKGTLNCHNCGGSCSSDGLGEHSGSTYAHGAESSNADVVAEVTKQVMKQLGLN